TAIGTNDAEGQTHSAGIGAFTISLSGVDSEVTPDARTQAKIGTGSIDSSGAINLTATSHNTAHATADAANIGLFAGALAMPIGQVRGPTPVEIGAQINSGDSVDMEAPSTNPAPADSAIVTAGLIAGGGAGTDAEVTSEA